MENKNFAWELMVFELNGNRLNEFGAMSVAETQLRDGGNIITGTQSYPLLTNRLYTPTTMERFAAI